MSFILVDCRGFWEPFILKHGQKVDIGLEVAQSAQNVQPFSPARLDVHHFLYA